MEKNVILVVCHVNFYKCVTQLLQMCHTLVTNVSHNCYKIGHTIVTE